MTAKNITRYEKIYDSYAPAVYGMIHLCIRNEAMANEILQDVFVKFFRDQVLSESNISLQKLLAFARKITCSFINENLHRIDFYRSNKQSAQLMNEFIIQLVCLGKYTTDQVASLLEIDEQSVRQHLSAAVKNYRISAAVA